MNIQIKSTSLFAAMLLCNAANIYAAALPPVDQHAINPIVTVIDPVADIRIKNQELNTVSQFILPENSDDQSLFYADNKHQETQVLFGDKLSVAKEESDWVFVEILSQKSFNSLNQAVPCSGWINKKAITNKMFSQGSVLTVKTIWAPISFKTEQGEKIFNISIGTRLFGKKTIDGLWKITLDGVEYKIKDEHVQKITTKRDSIKDLRVDLIERAKLFLSSPYIWGGTSAPLKFYPGIKPENIKAQVAGVDCSGLVHILFKSLGLCCPRNSNDQYMFSDKIEYGKDLIPGDLIFFAKVNQDGKTPQRVTHVAIYAGNDEQNNTLIIESQGVATPYGVRMLKSTDLARLGNKQLSDIKTGDVFKWTDERNNVQCLSYISFGTFFTTQKLEDMRLEFLNN